jgi:hypothetical protein
MSAARLAKVFLHQEARALRTRIDRMVPFSVSMTMVPAAAISADAMSGIEAQLRDGRQVLRAAIDRFLGWLGSRAGRAASAAEAQRRFMILRLRFHSSIAQFDIFADVLVQRSENGNGVWIAGLDDLAADALTVPNHRFETPPIVCYLDRGVGAAIRRARTRLPGGNLSPVAVIRVPRERMIGQGIGSSLVHEVGHQAAALLDLLAPLRRALQQKQRTAADAGSRMAWFCLDRWCSEILADFWAVAKLGVSATVGLIGVVSLPRVFVFRIELRDPHPFPWIRVLASAALGQALYPHPQWSSIVAMWKEMYPVAGMPLEIERLARILDATLPEFTSVVLGLMPRPLRGRRLGACMMPLDRSPDRLASVWQRIKHRRDDWHRLPPTLALAAISQARFDGKLTAEQESAAIARLLTEWAVRSALDAAHGQRACRARWLQPKSAAVAS